MAAPPKRVLLLVSALSYRSPAFLAAGERMGLEIIQGTDLPLELAEYWNVPLGIPFGQPDVAVKQIVEFVSDHPIDAILPVDDASTLIAARASQRLGLPYNSPDTALAARDKYEMRRRLAAAGVPQAEYELVSLSDNPEQRAAAAQYPCVLKPLRLSGSRGVIRANDPVQFAAAFRRIQRMLISDGQPEAGAQILVERFIPGCEVALEGLLTGGELQVLALFDKPDPLDGPFFEETIYVTPSRLPRRTQQAISKCAAAAAAAIGLREGPVHAELRVNDQGPWLIELAGRSIGGLCSSVLEFEAGMTLEELILRHAVGIDIPSTRRKQDAAGVMMIPIPGAGRLKAVQGVDEASAVPGVQGVTISVKPNARIVPLPEGASYLGFIFARAKTPADVELALRQAHAKLRFEIQPELPVLSSAVR